MFTFNYADGATLVSSLLVWLLVFAALFALNEVSRRFKAVEPAGTLRQVEANFLSGYKSVPVRFTPA